MRKQFMAVMVFIFIIFGSLLTFLVYFTDPQKGLVTVIPFFLSVFFVLFSFSTALSYGLRKWFSNNELYFANKKVSARQGFFFAFFLSTALFLSSIKLLTWWDALLIAAALLFLELFFESNKTVEKRLE